MKRFLLQILLLLSAVVLVSFAPVTAQLVCSTSLHPLRSAYQTDACRTDVRVQRDSLEVAIFPNPAREYITAHFEQDAGTILVLYIINAKGEEIYRYTSRTAGQQWIHFDLNNLPSGAYYLRAETGDVVSTKKFVKKH